MTTLVLVDSSGTNNPPPDLVIITEGATLDLDALGVAYTNVNVRAEVDGAVGSVTFALTGATANSQTESVGPYYLFGDATATRRRYAEHRRPHPGGHPVGERRGRRRGGDQPHGQLHRYVHTVGSNA